MTVAAFMSAHAQGTTVTLNPAAAGLSSQGAFTANNYALSDFATIIIDNATGNFTQTGTLRLNQFFNGPNPVLVPTSGLGNGTGSGAYGLFLTFSASGTLPNFVQGADAKGSFSSISYSFIGNPGNTDAVSSAGVLAQSASDITLATGGIAAGGRNQVSITNGLPSADVSLSLLQTAAGPSFFQAPTSLNLQEDSFTNTSSVVSLTPVGGTTVININGGGGNGTFSAPAAPAPVPEPASMALLGAGLVGIGIARKRKTHA